MIALIVEWGIALIIAALAAITILYALAVASDRRHQPAPPVDDAVTKLSHWQDEPPVIPNRDPITAEIERWLTEGDKHRD